MKKLSTLKLSLEKEGLQVRIATLNNVNGFGVTCPVLIVNTEYEGVYPDKECVNKHTLARKIGKDNFNYEQRGHYSALFITERSMNK
nr:MAG TPA: hypothetical protein [Caudoviricetes sp.]